MKILEVNELMSADGGSFMSALKIGLFGLGAVGVFVASVIYGYIHPNKCN